MMILPYADEKGCTVLILKKNFQKHIQLTSKHASSHWD